MEKVGGLLEGDANIHGDIVVVYVNFSTRSRVQIVERRSRLTNN